MGGLFGGGPKIPTPAPVIPVPTLSSPSVLAAEQAQAAATAQAAGRASTLLTGPQGDTSTTAVAKKTLLGGGG